MKSAQKKLTILLDYDLYYALQRHAGQGNIGAFIANAVRPHVYSAKTLEDGYRAMAQDTVREREAIEWGERLIAE